LRGAALLEQCSGKMRVVKGLLERCVTTVEALTLAPTGLRLSDLARELGMPKAAAHRLLAELVRLGWVEHTAATTTYRLGLRLPLVTQRVLHATGLADLVQPVLDRVARETRELARCAVALPDCLAWLAHAQGAPPGLLYQPAMSDPVRPHATANGKAWLATLEPALAMEMARAGGLGTLRPTPRTLATEAELAEELRRIAARGWAVAEEEAERGVVAIAVAVRPSPGPAAATVSVAGPLVRLPAERWPAIAARLAAAAGELEAVWPRATAGEATGA
jgi:DNA-binding IclR family transcriptional regulator